MCVRTAVWQYNVSKVIHAESVKVTLAEAKIVVVSKIEWKKCLKLYFVI